MCPFEEEDAVERSSAQKSKFNKQPSQKKVQHIHLGFRVEG